MLRGFPAALICALTPGVQAGYDLPVVFQTGFEPPAALTGWDALPSGASLEAYGGTLTLKVERVESKGPGSVMARIRMPLDRIRGRRLRLTARIRAEAVLKPPNPWNGVKFMFHTSGPAGKRWEQPNGVWGGFDWREVRFNASVPADATEAWLMLGLEETTGCVWFDDVRILVRPREVTAKTRGKPFRGHNLPRLRGAMIGRVDAEDLRVFAEEWNGNHVRWQLTWGGFPQSPADDGDLAAYDRWLESEMKRLDTLLPLCEKLGIRVAIDLHTPPGGRNEASVCRIFLEQRFQEKFLQVWDRIVRRFRSQKAVWGWDLLNEPVEGAVWSGLPDWQELAEKTARMIRKLDPARAIIVEPANWGGPEALDNLDPIPVRGIVYSIHMYVPHRFTHQGIYGNPSGIAYPGVVEGRRWDREQLRKTLWPVVEWQRRNNAHIYLGEFSAIRWAPGASAHDYLRDVIELAEEFGWDWAYHAYREWDGWSVEHGPDPQDHRKSRERTDRERLLRSWYAKNRR